MSENEVLIVASKLKKYIKDTHELSTSANVLAKITEVIKAECDKACENTKNDKRKTLMDRDFE